MGIERDIKEGAKQVPLEQITRRLTEQRQRAHYGEDRPALTDARQPQQLRSGPGGSAYSHAGVRTHLYGQDSLAYWVFEPSDPSPKAAPLVIFLHGWGGGSPSMFGAWIDHLVRRGNLVVFPVYQGSLRPWSKPWEQIPAVKMLENVITSVKDAIKGLQKRDHVRPELDRYAIVGLSLGGALTAQMAAVAAQSDLPIPKAIMPVAPGRGIWALRPLPPVDLRTIPSSVLMVVIVCEDDKNAGDREGNAIFIQTPQIQIKNKNLVVMVSDYHGTPPLVANHSSLLASHTAYEMASLYQGEWLNQSTGGTIAKGFSEPNAMHYYGYWKLFDGLTDAAFYHRNREYALGNTPEQRFMGIWSDGVPVKELKVITRPEMIPPLRLAQVSGLRRWLARRVRQNNLPE